MKKKNIIIVTGASSGMGKEFVKQVDARFPNVDEIWLIARRKDLLQKVADNCRHTCRVLAYDLCTDEAIEELHGLLQTETPRIRLLVNSAGYGIMGLFYKEEKQFTRETSEDIGEASQTNFTKRYDPEQTKMAEQTGMIDLNCRVLTAVTYMCIPYMQPNGRIIQLASSAGFLPQPKFAVYAATKSYVLSFSRALNEELRSKKIHVTAVCPGPVNTEFFERAQKGENTLLIKKLAMAKPEKVVRKALLDARDKKEVSVYGPLIRLFYIWTKVVPHRWILRILGVLKTSS